MTEHPAEVLLGYLERVSVRNDKWRQYIAQRSVEVWRWVYRLRGFAGRRSGAVADTVNARADGLESRLLAVLKR